MLSPKTLLGGFCFALLLTFSSSVRSATLVAHWEFEDASNLGLDSSGNGNDLTMISPGIHQVPGHLPGTEAAYFDESLNQIMERPGGLNSYTGMGGVSFTAWINRTGANGYDGIISQDSGGCCGHRLLVSPNDTIFFNSGYHQDIDTGQTIMSGQWEFVAMTVQDDGMGGRNTNIYINGNLVAGPYNQSPALPDASTWNTYLGSGEGGVSHLLTGALDDVRVYQGALTDAAVKAVYLGTVPEPGAAGLLIAGVAGVAMRRRKK